MKNYSGKLIKKILTGTKININPIIHNIEGNKEELKAKEFLKILLLFWINGDTILPEKDHIATATKIPVISITKRYASKTFNQTTFVI